MFGYTCLLLLFVNGYILDSTGSSFSIHSYSVPANNDSRCACLKLFVIQSSYCLSNFPDSSELGCRLSAEEIELIYIQSCNVASERYSGLLQSASCLCEQ